jgi:hypothetical protein
MVSDRQPAEKCRHMRDIGCVRREIAGQATEEAADPADVGPFGAAAVMACPQNLPCTRDQLHPLRPELRFPLGRRTRAVEALLCLPLAAIRRSPTRMVAV